MRMFSFFVISAQVANPSVDRLQGAFPVFTYQLWRELGAAFLRLMPPRICRAFFRRGPSVNTRRVISFAEFRECREFP